MTAIEILSLRVAPCVLHSLGEGGEWRRTLEIENKRDRTPTSPEICSGQTRRPFTGPFCFSCIFVTSLFSISAPIKLIEPYPGLGHALHLNVHGDDHVPAIAFNVIIGNLNGLQLRAGFCRATTTLRRRLPSRGIASFSKLISNRFESTGPLKRFGYRSPSPERNLFRRRRWRARLISSGISPQAAAPSSGGIGRRLQAATKAL